MTDDALDWAGVAHLRQGLYRFFGAALLTPSKERLVGLTAGAELLDSSGIESFAFAGPWQKLMATMAELPPVDELGADYIGLFVVGSGNTPCPPIESHYLGRPEDGDNAAIIGTLDRLYRTLALSLSPNIAHTQDHVAIELEVMAALCEREHQSWAQEAFGEVAEVQETQLGFLEEHLGRWFGMFARQVTLASRSGFYADVTAAAAAFVHHDEEFVRVVSRERPELETT